MRRSPTLIHSCAIRALFFLVAFVVAAHVEAAGGPPGAPATPPQSGAPAARGTSRIIIQAVDASSSLQLGPAIQRAGGRAGRRLGLINGQVATVPTAALYGLSHNPLIAHISADRPIAGTMERTGATIGATAVRQELGFDGTGVGVAIIDSGVTPHDDLTGANGGQRIDQFVDFVNGGVSPYDDYGHGTHIAGIIAGNGTDSGGARTGIAPGAHLIVLKVLDASGNGHISDVIAALDYVVAHKDDLHIRIVNLSVGAGVYESFNSDPLTLAAKRAVSAGIVVVAPAGNAGHDVQGTTAYGGITAPGNAPWVLTVGASSHMGTDDPGDDTVADFSSRGPTAVDTAAKPDVLAPGVGIESLSAPGSYLYSALAPYLLGGTVVDPPMPYLSLSGTSMSAPVVAGTVALMMQANPWLKPNAVKAILQYTSRPYSTYDQLTQGAGFLNAKGAVELAARFADPGTYPYPDSSDWSARIIWGNRVIVGGQITQDANAWSRKVTWGDAVAADGSDIFWGRICFLIDGDDECKPWGMGQNRLGFADNVVWGSVCGGADCTGPWSTTSGVTLSYMGAIATTVVWGSTAGDTVVWGSDAGDTVVWGSTSGDTVVWGSTCTDLSCEPIIWGKP